MTLKMAFHLPHLGQQGLDQNLQADTCLSVQGLGRHLQESAHEGGQHMAERERKDGCHVLGLLASVHEDTSHASVS